jgi:hypothetical protein
MFDNLREVRRGQSVAFYVGLPKPCGLGWRRYLRTNMGDYRDLAGYKSTVEPAPAGSAISEGYGRTRFYVSLSVSAAIISIAAASVQEIILIARRIF